MAGEIGEWFDARHVLSVVVTFGDCCCKVLGRLLPIQRDQDDFLKERFAMRGRSTGNSEEFYDVPKRMQGVFSFWARKIA